MFKIKINKKFHNYEEVNLFIQNLTEFGINNTFIVKDFNIYIECLSHEVKHIKNILDNYEIKYL